MSCGRRDLCGRHVLAAGGTFVMLDGFRHMDDFERAGLAFQADEIAALDEGVDKAMNAALVFEAAGNPQILEARAIAMRRDVGVDGLEAFLLLGGEHLRNSLLRNVDVEEMLHAPDPSGGEEGDESDHPGHKYEAVLQRHRAPLSGTQLMPGSLACWKQTTS